MATDVLPKFTPATSIFSAPEKPVSSSSVKVVVRVRPNLKSEASGQTSVIVEGEQAILLKNCKVKIPEVTRYQLRFSQTEPTNFSFDHCYGPDIDQEFIFQNDVCPLIPKLYEGINVTVFAYGMTGAGKTHTMQGTSSNPGIIPRAVQEVLEWKKKSTKIVTVTASYLEIYNEKVVDLLNTANDDLPIREDMQRNIFIPKLEEIPLETVDDFHKTYDQGCKNRTVASTKLNSKSSRSHAIMMIKVAQKDKPTSAKTLIGKLHLIDLAGSEDNRRTENIGVRLQESSNINNSLFVLGKVVNALHSKKVRLCLITNFCRLESLTEIANSLVCYKTHWEETVLQL
jgi:kinesin family protein 22